MVKLGSLLILDHPQYDDSNGHHQYHVIPSWTARYKQQDTNNTNKNKTKKNKSSRTSTTRITTTKTYKNNIHLCKGSWQPWDWELLPTDRRMSNDIWARVETVEREEKLEVFWYMCICIHMWSSMCFFFQQRFLTWYARLQGTSCHFLGGLLAVIWGSLKVPP